MSQNPGKTYHYPLISSINASTISLDNVVFNVLDSNGKIEGISTVPHNL